LTTSDHPYGSRPKPGQPDYFQFTATSIAEAFGLVNLPGSPLLTWLSTSLLNLPLGSLATADFCSRPPPTDLASAGDLVAIAAAATWLDEGAYQRAHNSIVAWEWSNRCEWKPAPDAPNPPVSPAPPGSVCGDPTTDVLVWRATAPAGTALLTFSNGTYQQDGVYVPWNNSRFWLAVSTVPFPSSGPYAPPAPLIDAQLQNVDSQMLISIPQAAQGSQLYLGIHSLANQMTATDCIQFSWSYQLAQAPGTAEPAPAAPPAPNVPARAGCPTVSDTQGLANLVCDLTDLVNSLDAKLTALLNREPVSITVPAPPVDVGTGAPQPKPAGAIGVVVQVTDIPPQYPHYGNPAFYPNIGHLLLETDQGPLPSVLIKHNPMVVIFDTPLVTQIALDLSPGVSAQAQFIHPQTV
jgi:hypothetical protein